jgi:ParB-like chromosome segregation protein Spo0J
MARTPKILSEKYELVPLGELALHPRNPRKGDLKTLKQSVVVNGFYGAVVVQKSTRYILAGNHRFLAAKAAGMTEIPVVWIDVDDRTARRILLADNRTSDLGEYNDDLLAKLLEELRNEEDFVGSGYTEEDLDKLLKDLGDDALDASPQLDGLEYKVVVDCASEEEQAMLLEKLQGEGLTCRPLIS